MQLISCRAQRAGDCKFNWFVWAPLCALAGTGHAISGACRVLGRLCSHHSSLVAPYRAILRYYRCDTPFFKGYFFREASAPPKWCDTPPCYLVSHRHICFATYRAIIVRDPHKNKHEGVLRYYRYKYFAICKVLLLGL